MSIASSHFEAAVESLSRRIVEAEIRSTAAVEGLAALIMTHTVAAASARLPNQTS
ncbi:hypothetical protein [Methylobacterium sp. P1-11]|uniref:hypothetical protein n=1 Tax=Methylobacterium sp. P1-11 TaxID=2024616 RepID=UPI001563CE51|nr:hypothetical protein [Methylobacterium sp. P1-11]